MARWAADRFHRRAAALAWTGPPPPDDLTCLRPDGPPPLPPIALDGAWRASTSSLPSVPDRRTLFLLAPDERVVEQLHHRDSGGRTACRLLAQDLVLAAPDGATHDRDVDPKGRADESAAGVRRVLAAC